ncbi:LacI family transcriptional regulator [Cellulomonas iranensis]|uniref:LacI family DNA-binding transcriptional regulator n=1 Tax=Cellulomonas iranensis TaxID=76862 RepID=UPI001CF33CA1|nr:LacI family DNA-binding transcriptional regulator [Cellulomonas iranensis]UCN13687.1 LacI family transcriptional regulator [Cellulomonas iranensis]
MERTRKVTIKDVARHAGLSSTTVSVILNGRADEFRIAQPTRDVVLAAAAELGYRTPRSTRPRKVETPTGLWTILAPYDFDAGPTVGFFNGVRAYTREHRLDVETVLLPFERGRLRDKARWLTPGFTSGVILVGLDDDDVAYVEGADLDVPVVLFNRVAKRSSAVSIDDYGTGHRAAEHVLARGRTNASVIAPEYASRHLSVRAVGFADGLRERLGAAAAEAMPQVRAEISFAGGHTAVRALLERGPAPDALFVLHDGMVGGVLRCLDEHGLAVPADVDVVSYGDSAINTILRPSVTSFAVPVEAMSYECARRLHQAGLHPGATDSVGRVFDAELVLRESSPAVTR